MSVMKAFAVPQSGWVAGPVRPECALWLHVSTQLRNRSDNHDGRPTFRLSCPDDDLQGRKEIDAHWLWPLERLKLTAPARSTSSSGSGSIGSSGSGSISSSGSDSISSSGSGSTSSSGSNSSSGSGSSGS